MSHICLISSKTTSLFFEYIVFDNRFPKSRQIIVKVKTQMSEGYSISAWTGKNNISLTNARVLWHSSSLFYVKLKNAPLSQQVI